MYTVVCFKKKICGILISHLYFSCANSMTERTDNLVGDLDYDELAEEGIDLPDMPYWKPPPPRIPQLKYYFLPIPTCDSLMSRSFGPIPELPNEEDPNYHALNDVRNTILTRRNNIQLDMSYIRPPNDASIVDYYIPLEKQAQDALALKEQEALALKEHEARALKAKELRDIKVHETRTRIDLLQLEHTLRERAAKAEKNAREREALKLRASKVPAYTKPPSIASALRMSSFSSTCEPSTMSMASLIDAVPLKPCLTNTSLKRVRSKTPLEHSGLPPQSRLTREDRERLDNAPTPPGSPKKLTSTSPGSLKIRYSTPPGRPSYRQVEVRTPPPKEPASYLNPPERPVKPYMDVSVFFPPRVII